MKATWKSSKIGDASHIGLECPSGDVSNCNDGTDEIMPSQLQGYLVLSETETQCGSNCNLNSSSRSFSSPQSVRYFWTQFTSQAIDSKVLPMALSVRYKWYLRQP